MRPQFTKNNKKKKNREGGNLGCQCYIQFKVELYEVKCELESASEIMKILKEALRILDIKLSPCSECCILYFG
jgi:hypothetical protein